MNSFVFLQYEYRETIYLHSISCTIVNVINALKEIKYVRLKFFLKNESKRDRKEKRTT